jgi:DNA helicase-2/ATP-dependent DNA helicase PcrA
MPISLNHSQQAAVLSQHARVLALASPGSGKTRSLVARAANLIYRGATAPRRIVIITFTNAAADEIRERIATVILPEEAKAIGYIGTLHGYCLRLLDQYGDSIGYRHGVSVIDEERAEALLADALAATGYKISKAALADAKLKPRSSWGTIMPSSSAGIRQITMACWRTP